MEGHLCSETVGEMFGNLYMEGENCISLNNRSLPWVKPWRKPQDSQWLDRRWNEQFSQVTWQRERARREGSEIQPEFTLAYVQLGLGLRCYVPTAGRLCSLLLTRAQLCLRTFPYHYSRIVCNFSSSEIKHEHHPWHEGAANDEWSATDASPARKLQKGEVCQMQKKKKSMAPIISFWCCWSTSHQRQTSDRRGGHEMGLHHEFLIFL